MTKNKKQIIKLVSLAMLTAIVIVLQTIGSNIKFGPYSPALVLVPITIGAILFGPKAGTFLGLVFGIVVLFSGDAQLFYAISIPGTIITVLLKGALAGLASGLVFKALKNKNIHIGILLAALVAPVVNSVLFRVGMVVFFYDMLSASASSSNANTFVYLFLGLTGFNFILEFGLNLILAPTISRVCELVSKQLNLGVFDLKSKSSDIFESELSTETVEPVVKNLNI